MSKRPRLSVFIRGHNSRLILILEKIPKHYKRREIKPNATQQILAQAHFDAEEALIGIQIEHSIQITPRKFNIFGEGGS